MNNIQNVRALVQEGAENALIEFKAVLGRADGTVQADAENVYVTLLNGNVITVYNERVPRVPFKKVVIGYVDSEPSLLQVLRFDAVYNSKPHPNLPNHRESHAWFSYDPLDVYLQQIMPLLPRAVGDLTIRVYGGDYVANAIPCLLATTDFDMTDEMPSSGAEWVSVFIDENKAITYEHGTNRDSRELLLPGDKVIVSGTKKLLFAVKMYQGLTKFIQTRKDSDVFDPRLSVVGSGGGGGLTNPVDVINFNTVYTSGGEPVGSMYWNSDEECLDIIFNDGVTQQVGLELFVNVINQTGSTLVEGRGIGFAGSLGASGQLLAKYYLADGEPSTYFIGVSTHDILNGELGKVTIFGKIRQIDTTGSPFGETWADGDILWASSATAGYLSNARPARPAKGIQAAAVVKAHSNGTIMVRPTFFFDLAELNDAEIADEATGDTLIRDGDVWKNYPVYADSKDPTGWVDPSAITVSYDGTTRKITLTGTLDYYWRGIKKSLTSPWVSDAHDAADGRYFLYSEDGTTFAWSTSTWDFYELMVAIARKKTTPAYQFGLREPHGLMPWQVHRELHETLSAYRVSGGGLTSGTYAENSASDADTTPGFDAFVLADEDIDTTIPAWVQGTYTTLRIGASNVATFDAVATFPFRSSGSYILVNDPTTGAETAATNNQYVNVYIIRIPTTADTDSQKYRLVCLQPQRTFSSLAAAQAEDTRSLVLGDIDSSLPEFVFFERITYVLAAGDSNTGKCRIATGGISYIFGSRMSQISAGGIGAIQTAENTPFTPAGTISATNVQKAIEEVAAEAGGGGGAFQRVLSANLTLADGESLVISDYIDGNGYDLTLEGDAALVILSGRDLPARSGSATSSATPTINTDVYDSFELTAQAVDITSMTTNLSGTPTRNQTLLVVITGTAARAITWGASFENGSMDLPTTTVTTETLEVMLRWNAITSKWRCMAWVSA